MYDNEFKTKGSKIKTKDKTEPQQLHYSQLNKDVLRNDSSRSGLDKKIT